MSQRSRKLADIEEEDTGQSTNRPLELGGFLTPVDNPPIATTTATTTTTPTATLARDLAAGHAILVEDRPYEITRIKNSLAKTGPLNARHKVTLELMELFDKGKGLDPLIVKATDPLLKVQIERVRYTVIGIDGDVRQIIGLQKQQRDADSKQTNKPVLEFYLPAGRIGGDLGAFFALCDSDEEEDKAQIPTTLLVLEAMGRYQVIGFGIGDWESLN